MTKGDITKTLASIANGTEISITDSEGIQVDIKHLNYRWNNGVSEVTIVPMGSHLPKDEIWVRIE